MTDQHGTAAGAGLVLVAAGRGTRLGAGMPKALVRVGRGQHEAPIIVHALRAVLRCRALTHVVVVAPPDPVGMQQLTSVLRDAFPALLDRAHGVHPEPPHRAHGVHPSDPHRAHGVHPSDPDRAHALHPFDPDRGHALHPEPPHRAHGVPAPGVTPRVTVVAGGAERADSVARGLRALPPEIGVVLVHDAARALTPVEVFDRVVHAVHAGHAAVTPALPVTDTVKEVRVGPTGTETVVATLDRSVLRAVQTPQGFLRETLERAHAETPHGLPAHGPTSPARPSRSAATDDCGLVEAHGGHVTVVRGSSLAMKITTPQDLELATAWLESTTASRPPARQPGTSHGPDVAAPQPRVAPVLVVLSGLPGVGKTTLARALCRRLGAVHLRVDTLEQGLMRGGLQLEHLAAQGYGAAYAVAADQLAVGLTVVADMVNGVEEARHAWAQVAEQADARLLRVLVECSDADEHRRRVETRTADIEGHRLPDWHQASTRELAPWPEAEVRVDTATDSLEEAVTRLAEALR